MDSATLLKRESLMRWQMAKNRYILHAVQSSSIIYGADGLMGFSELVLDTVI
jgi:hypothetical protein